MKPHSNALEQQLQILSDAVRVCEASCSELAGFQTQLHSCETEKAARLAEIQQLQNAQLQQELQRLDAETEQQRETLQLDVDSRIESWRAQRDQARQLREHELNEESTRLAEQEKNELWVLQSVLDEDADDSPTDQLEREQDTFQLQKTSMDERAGILQQQISQTQQFLKDCHAETDITSVAPESVVQDGRDLTDVIREQGDQLLATAADLESWSLPSWIRGSRLWILSVTVAVLTFIPVLLIRIRPAALLNPDLQPPNWQWLLVAVLCGIAAAVCVAGLCVTLVQNRLRSGFHDMLRHQAAAQQLSCLWEERTTRQLEKMERAAEKWRRKVARRRERQTADIQARFAAQQDILNQQQQQLQQDFDNELAAQTEQAHQHLAAEQQRIAEFHQQQRRRADQESADRIREQEAACISDLDRQAQMARQEADQRIKQWNQQLDIVQQLTQNSTQAGSISHRWPILPDADWAAPEHMPTAMSPGDLLLTLPKPPESAVQPVSTSLCIEMPALLTFPDNTSILVEHDATGREAALGFIRTQVLRLLTLIPPGRIRLTLIDPVGLGQSFSAMMHLTDYDELLIHSRIWTDEIQIRGQLRKITEHMENVFQTYLRSEFSTIEEYNESAGEVAEPYHFVVVAGFPQAFSEEAARHLSSILTSGPSCGVHTLIAWNPSMGSPSGFDVEDLYNSCTRFHVQDQLVRPHTELPPALIFEATPEPAAGDSVNIVKAVGVKSRNARRVEVSFRRVAPHPDAVWTQSTADSIDLPIGRAGAARLQFLRLGRGTSQHVLVAGKTGSGKSTFLHIVITNLALHFSPDEIQFYLIDFKKGVEFRTYAANRLPHARVVAIESDREFGLSVLERLDAVLQERGELFRSRGVQDIPSFRRQFPEESMPRLLLLIDEFQEFFVAEDRVSSRASLLLDRLVRQGRAFGIHVMLGSQTLGGAYSLARSTMGQVAVRVALQCSESDAHLILSEDNAAARLLTRPGEAIYNDANGLKEGNHPFQIAWLEDDEREEMIQQLKDRPDRPSTESSMVVFEGNVAPLAEQCGPLNVAFRARPDATRRSFDAHPIWLGEPVAIAAPTHVELRRAGGQNLLLVGQDESLIDSMLAMIALSAGAAAPSGATVTLLHSIRNPEVAERYQQLTSSGAVPGCQLLAEEQCTSVIDSLTTEMKRREELSDHSDAAEMLLIIRDIGQFRELRREEDDFSLGGFGEAKTETTSSRFADLIRRGPLVGIHVIVWADTFSNAMRWLSTSLLREFEDRIGLRMNQTDSSSLVDSPVAAGLGQGRALLYRDQTGNVEKFRPFAWPSDEWLRQVVRWRSDSSGPELDIESLHIE